MKTDLNSTPKTSILGCPSQQPHSIQNTSITLPDSIYADQLLVDEYEANEILACIFLYKKRKAA